jgi:enamine deaminase RidA (YjgF/YER057c/UK114 family)
MTVALHNIAGFPTPQGFSHASVARGSRIVHISGQAGTDDNGTLVAGGLAAQVKRALLNVTAALQAAGGTNDDLARLTYYIVGWNAAMFEELARGVRAARAERSFADVASTLIGVTSLFTADMLIEIDAVAVIES